MLRRPALLECLKVMVLTGTLGLTYPLAYGVAYDEALIHVPSFLGIITCFCSFAYLNATAEKETENVSMDKDNESLY